MCNNITYPIGGGVMLGYSDDEWHHHKHHVMTLGVQVHLLIFQHELTVVQGACQCYTMVYKSTKIFTIDTCHEYAQKFFLLHTKTQDYHLKYPNVPLWILKCRLLLFFILFFPLKEDTYVNERNHIDN